MNKTIFIFTGLSCAGKDTCQNYIVSKYGFKPLISTTTRPIRSCETDGINYHFIKKEEFEKKIDNNELIEYRKYNTLVNNEPDTWYYGVEKKEVESADSDKLVVVLDSTGYEAFKEFYSDQVTMVWIDCFGFIRKDRCVERGDYNKYEFHRRNIVDKKRFVKLPKQATYRIRNNGRLSTLFKKLDKIVSLVMEKQNG